MTLSNLIYLLGYYLNCFTQHLSTKFLELAVRTVCISLLSCHLLHSLLQFGPFLSFSITFKNGTCSQVSSSNPKLSTLTYVQHD